MGPRILVTGIGSPAGRAVAAQLSARGIPVLGADDRDVPGPDGAETVRIPPPDDPDWVPALRRLIDARTLNMVIPTLSEELPYLTAVRVLGLTGPVDVDIRCRADATPVVLGVSAHFGVSSASAPELLDAVLATFLLPSFNPLSFRRCPAVFAKALG